MKILISSQYFYPSLGGSETNAEILAREFLKQGHEIKLTTQTPGTPNDLHGKPFPFEVIRQPQVRQLIALTRWCNVCLQNGVILRQLWALWLTQTPWVIRHQTWVRQPHKNATLLIQLKLLAVKLATSISISKAIAQHLHHPSTIIPNPYRDDQFRLTPEVQREKDLVYVGRLVSDKGVDLLLQAVADLKAFDLIPKLTVIGSGKEEHALRHQSIDLGIDAQVTFVGSKTGDELVTLLNQHHILVIPSRWYEPFGVVALEGIACGCVVVGSSEGGLKDAIGDCGITFPNGDEVALTDNLRRLLTQPDLLARYRTHASSHLAKHRQAVVAKAYLQVLQSACQ
ncbi:glycosyltransferase family 4 protein [Nodosilinea sp. LEGE 07298]|uniref:glycosyltransferase family 4 protein n=1 Tax=Nodosilinea sp. LEGE 07298 TaxID=2777970 RepID=UPI00188167D4|nr:glycosyltransferase family 4 protein [Nodosilinea sp. LEGE 07298]MBE9109136.1 glycosyltransferase family 4 protein [Nodosilinea sp. LEGE 07298]